MKKVLNQWISLLLSAILLLGCGSALVYATDETQTGEEINPTNSSDTINEDTTIARAKNRISAGDTQSIAIDNEGNVLVWGYNDYGQLGDEKLDKNATQSKLSGLDVLSVGSGYKFNVALKKDGTVWAWGRSYDKKPKQVLRIDNVIDISCGSDHVLALKADGTVWAWGYNSYAQLGNGGADNSNFTTFPIQVKGISDVKGIYTTYNTCYVLSKDGTIWAWGRNARGEILGEKLGLVKSPVQIKGINDVKELSVGGDFALALKNDGTVWSWGKNDFGQLGNGTKTDSTKPVQVSNLKDVTSISAGSIHTLALKSDGTVWTWGDNNYGKLGDYTIKEKTTPVRVAGLKDVQEIKAGNAYSLAMKKDGSIWGWGGNARTYLLAEESFLTHPIPIFKDMIGDGDNPGEPSTSMPPIRQLYAGENHSLALCEDGTLWAWGNNADGQLGTGSSSNQEKPVQITGIGEVKSVVTGLNHTLIICEDGSVWVWGKNDHGQLGIGNTINQFKPVKLTN